MKKKSYLRVEACCSAFALIALFSSLAFGASLPKTGVAGSTHDVGGRGCNGCHAPHNGALANGGTQQATGAILLWARNFPNSTNTFGIYDSATMKNRAVELGGSALTTSTDVRMYSLLCLSCHDGVTSTFSPSMQTKNMVGARVSFGSTYESNGLTNDHPVNMTYDPTRNPSLQPVATVTATLPLYGTNNTMQCGTCHDAHNNVNTNYLRQQNNTTHCTTCHL